MYRDCPTRKQRDLSSGQQGVGLPESHQLDAAVRENGYQVGLAVEPDYREFGAAAHVALIVHELFDAPVAVLRDSPILERGFALLTCSIVLDEVMDETLRPVHKAFAHVKVPLENDGLAFLQIHILLI